MTEREAAEELERAKRVLEFGVSGILVSVGIRMLGDSLAAMATANVVGIIALVVAAIGGIRIYSVLADVDSEDR